MESGARSTIKLMLLKDYRPIVCRASGIYLGEQKKATRIQVEREKETQTARRVSRCTICRRARSPIYSCSTHERSHFGKIEFLCVAPGMIQLTPRVYSMFVGGNVCTLHNGARTSLFTKERRKTKSWRGESAASERFSCSRVSKIEDI